MTSAVPEHRHPEIEDRISGETSAVTTELVALRADTRRGFDLVHTLLAEQSDTLRQILEHLGRQDGGRHG